MVQADCERIPLSLVGRTAQDARERPPRCTRIGQAPGFQYPSPAVVYLCPMPVQEQILSLECIGLAMSGKQLRTSLFQTARDISESSIIFCGLASLTVSIFCQH